ncbi:MAG: BREX-1 system adenine-specific DNA-methyltransferase PglX, partial [Gordonibacter sp.]|uniref:BREX-1 system adenine-specific DNA-methyltransferase PglX n=1 Tax=Gordonibacter sp. TaxID=1968902 RepID=UPI002FC9229A
MDSNKIKNLATGAREALRAEVNARFDAVLAPDSAERLDNPNSIHVIEAAISDRGRDHVVDQAAYTWFNRLCALRYMDARGYTPVPVVTPRKGSTQPAILTDATQGVFAPEYQMSRLIRDRVSSLLMGTTPSDNATEAAYAQLIGAVCARYAGPMPYLFEEEVASSLLMPQGLLSEGSILQRIVEDMDDNNCASVEVLGWLYQYYVAEKKDEIFASNKKRGADEIGPATQLFTPNWIVRYMAENSLGRIWMLNNPSSGLRDAMEYYIEGETPDEYLKVYSASELKVLDPACGSGHILVYCFDLLFSMYEEEGWQPEDIPAMILQNNLYGFEIDGRAGEIAKFALEMKAREKDPQFFDRHIDAMVSVLEPVRFSEDELNEAGLLAGNTPLLEAFDHLDEIGSLYVPELSDEVFIDNAIENLERSSGMFAEKTIEKLRKMKEQIQKLSQKFSAVVANPPYMPTSSLEPWAKEWVQKKYADAKSDFFAAFVLRNLHFADKAGELGFMTPFVWMFISSYEGLRKKLIDSHTITSLIQL